ncbi:Rne/Rng family ribonuclease [Nakamurella sp. YIM 132087]|uniref:Ribonuclease E n=1 Tax=Nakamurella alba TaxID=2665158 RepID=A0A7K1FGA6_9ACTN|nr:Rne/Rng family ribonuclease [Nakamurella alba]MTD13132.1 Rne/Rng family ribonuclease [Nakamurella alba]
MTEPTVSLAQALDGLPARLRVHELAKRAGLTSKETLARLAAAHDVSVPSAQSSVDRDVAEALLTVVLGADVAAADAAPAEATPVAADSNEAAPLFLPPAEVKTPRSRSRKLKAAPAEAREAIATEPAAEPGSDAADPAVDGAAPDATAPAKPARRRRGTKAATEPAPELTDASTAASPTEAPEATEESESTSAEQSADAASTTEPAEGEQATSGRGRGSRRGRGGRRGRGARAGDEPLPDETEALAPAEAADPAEAVGTDTTPSNESDDTESAEGAAEDDSEETGEAGGRRRRRRGRRGRGRPVDEAGETGDDETSRSADEVAAGSTDETGSAEDEGDTDDSDSDSGDAAEGADGSRRRRRRRRRGGDGEAGREDDPDNTVVHVRESRPASEEVQGVRGSTRLEAKRQRRRDSRESRGRRPQILTEAEFLARREAVDRVMAVRQRGDLAQVALLEDGVLVEHFVSRAGSESLMGNIYLGRVQNVLPSMEAAFVDIGRGRNAVLYAGEVNWDAAGLAGKARRIETALSSGDTILVQVSKDPVGHKGARLTTQISLPGRFLVYVPGGGATGISRKLPDTERKRLKSILDRIVPEDAGVIIRTAAEGVPEEDLARDVERLKSAWEDIQSRSQQKQSAPTLLSAEPDTLIKVVRDLFNSDINRLVLDGPDVYPQLSEYVTAVAPELADRVEKYEAPAGSSKDVFSGFRIDEQIAKALERKVHLPSGGSLVIDRTEAMTVVDVNTGKYTGSGGNLEETVTRNNLEAAEEIVRQMRLRDIGGIIVVDFIDMVLESNRELVLRRLTEALGRDRSRHQVAEVTSLGLVQMTRKKMGTGLVEAFSEPCQHCGGRGIVLHDVPVEQHSPDDDGDKRARGRRGRSGQDNNRNGAGGQNSGSGGSRAETPVEQPRVVVPGVRKPDPRGPKPPGFAAAVAVAEHPVDGAVEQVVVTADAAAPAEVPSEAPVSEESAADRGAREAAAAVASLHLGAGARPAGAALSDDASAAVSAVLAALEARTRDTVSPLGEPAADAAVAGVLVDPAQDGTAERTTGRRRGRRAAGRPAGPAASETTSFQGITANGSDGPGAGADGSTVHGSTAAVPVTGVVVIDNAVTTDQPTPAGGTVSVGEPAGAARPRRRRAASRPAGAPTGGSTDGLVTEPDRG